MPSILFIASNRIGDAVLSTGALDFAMRQHSGAALDLACGPLPAPLFRATPGLRRLITIEKRRGDRHWLRLWRDLAGARYDLAVDLRGTLITYALRARARIVHRKSAQMRHKVEELTATMGAPAILAPKVTLDLQARADAAAAAGEGPILALGPGANFIGKRWAPDRFAALARRLAGPAGPLAGARVALLGGPEDARANAEIAASLTTDAIPALDLAGRLDLLACAALLGACGSAGAAAPVQQPANVDPRSPERYLPLVHDTVFAYETSSEATGETGVLMMSVARPRSGLAEIKIGSRIQRLDLVADGIRHATGGYLLKAPLAVGSRYKGQFGEVRITTLDRSVQVPAGKFEGCLETVEETQVPAAKRATTVFCPDVGIVILVAEGTSDGEYTVERAQLRSHGPRIDINNLPAQ